jgi:hypothetical protein
MPSFLMKANGKYQMADCILLWKMNKPGELKSSWYWLKMNEKVAIAVREHGMLQNARVLTVLLDFFFLANKVGNLKME